MHRFFVEHHLDKALISIRDKALIHQLTKVLRLRKGDEVIFFNHLEGEAGFDVVAELKNREGSVLMFLVKDRIENRRESSKTLVLYCALLKKDKLEWVLQKGTEVGVARFVPVLAERSEKKGVNEARAALVLKEAAEQSGRAWVPSLAPVTPFSVALGEAFTSQGKTLVAHTQETENTVRPMGDRMLNLFIGPEGGWSKEEIFEAHKKGFETIALGRTVLRAETAAVVAAYTMLWG